MGKQRIAIIQSAQNEGWQEATSDLGSENKSHFPQLSRRIWYKMLNYRRETALQGAL